MNNSYISSSSLYTVYDKVVPVDWLFKTHSNAAEGTQGCSRMLSDSMQLLSTQYTLGPKPGNQILLGCESLGDRVGWCEAGSRSDNVLVELG